MSGKRSDRQRLQDIVDAIAAIARHPCHDYERFLRDEPLRWFFRTQIQIIGEASFKLSQAERDGHP